jgi:predicted dehydrogenase
MLALANRLDPAVQEARRLISAGQIGKMYGLETHLIADQTRLTRPAYQRSWFAHKARAGGGHLIWLGIHWLDLAMHLTGSRLREVAGFTGVVGGQPLDVEDSAAVVMKFDNGVFGTLTSGYYLDRGYHSHIKIWGSQGRLHVQKHSDLPLQWYSTKEANPQVRRLPATQAPSGYGPFVRATVRASAGLEDPPLTADDSLYALRTVFACYRAADTGKTQIV